MESPTQNDLRKDLLWHSDNNNGIVLKTFIMLSMYLMCNLARLIDITLKGSCEALNYP